MKTSNSLASEQIMNYSKDKKAKYHLIKVLKIF